MTLNNSDDILNEFKRIGDKVSKFFIELIKDGELKSVFKLAVVRVTLNTYLAKHIEMNSDFEKKMEELEKIYMNMIENVKFEILEKGNKGVQDK